MEARQTNDPSPRSPSIVWLIIVVASMMVGLAGNGSRLPLDDHEVLVARTSEEMLARGDWIVPYLNDQPRTAKPPLAYWATMLVDMFGDRDHIISEWEARVPSVIGGVLWALATFALGRALTGPLIGFVGSLLLIGSTGFLTYTHNARPELLYAMFCTAGLACFAHAWRSESDAGDSPAALARPWLWPALGWLSMSLAVLTKGPQLPVILLAAWAIGMALQGERRQILRTLRPFSGAAIVIVVAMWWFLIMWFGVEGASDRMGRETVGRILQIEGKPLTRIVDPYYVYRIISLILPWIVLYGFALAAPLIKQIRMPRSTRLLWWVSVITLAVMHLSLNRRWYYLLPLTSVLSVLMAWTALAIGQAMFKAGRLGIWRAAAITHIVLFAAALAYMWWANPELLKPTTMSLLVLAAVSAMACIAIAAHSRANDSPARSLLLTALIAIGFMTLAGERSSPWSLERFHRRDFSRSLAEALSSGAVVLGWNNDWQQEQYYLHRPIPSFEHRAQLVDALRVSADGQATYLLTSTRKPLDLPVAIAREEVVSSEVEEGERLTLWKINIH